MTNAGILRMEILLGGRQSDIDDVELRAVTKTETNMEYTQQLYSVG
jgi:hypothetical protein